MEATVIDCSNVIEASSVRYPHDRNRDLAVKSDDGLQVERCSMKLE